MSNETLKPHNIRLPDPFRETSCGLDEETAVQEALRCLDCRDMPCVSGCPLGVNIPAFIEQVQNREFEKAFEILSRSSCLPASCGRVCEQESYCQCRCTLNQYHSPMNIQGLERFVADWHYSHENPTEAPVLTKDKKVAIIGSGPSGLECAAELAKRGYPVTVFESLHKAGGVLVYGIPQFRLPKQVVEKELEALSALGVTIETNTVIGKTFTIDQLLKTGYDAVYIGCGAGMPNFMNIPGENLNGVYSANEFLIRNNLMEAYKDSRYTPIMKGKEVVVAGGDNAALDCARIALRLGAEHIHIVYRDSTETLPASARLLAQTLDEGITFHPLTGLVEIIGYDNSQNPEDPKNGFLKGVRCVRMKPADPGAGKNNIPAKIPDSEFILEADTVIVSIGTSPHSLIRSSTKDLSVNSQGGIIIEASTGATTKRGVFAGGDAVTGNSPIVDAMKAGKTAAAAIDTYLS